MNKHLRLALISLIASISLGALLTFALSAESTKVGSIPTFTVCAIIAYGLNYLAFVPSYFAKTEHYFDLTGSITTITLIAFATLVCVNPKANLLSLSLLPKCLLKLSSIKTPLKYF